MNSEHHIETRGLNKKFGYKTALRNIDIFLKEGDSLALFGPNGAGKSTLIQVLSTLQQPTSGSVRIAGMNRDVIARRCTRLLVSSAIKRFYILN